MRYYFLFILSGLWLHSSYAQDTTKVIHNIDFNFVIERITSEINFLITPPILNLNLYDITFGYKNGISVESVIQKNKQKEIFSATIQFGINKKLKKTFLISNLDIDSITRLKIRAIF